MSKDGISPLILDPRSVPVIGHDGDLPEITAERLQPKAVRAALRGHWEPEIPGDGARLRAREGAPTPASVLIPLVLREELTVLLTRRTDHLRDHAGQISFPGGRAEAEDTDAIDTALREATEEVGLDRAQVEVLGTMPIYRTVTAYEVTPVVAFVQPDHDLSIDPHEVAEVFEVPLNFLMTPRHHQRHLGDIGGARRQFLSMPWHGLDGSGQAREYFIWGATAAMLRNLYARLRDADTP